MPQLQPGDFAPQLIWLAITFAFLFFALSRLALPKIEQAIGDRKSRIGGDLEMAREAQRKSEEEAARYDAEVAAAKAKGQVSLRAAREKLEAELAEKRSVLERDTAAKAAKAEANIHSYIERASAQLEAITSEVVSDIVKELAGVDVSEDEVRAAVRQGLKE